MMITRNNPATFILLLLSSLPQICVVSAKPNILLILADDVGTGEVPGYWNTGLVNMTNLEDMVSKGTVFTDVHSTPLCAPSRYTILSGNYQHRGQNYDGTWGPNYERSQFRKRQRSIADLLRARGGYHTFMTGKWHMGGQIPTIDGYKPKDKWTNKKVMLTNSNHNWTKPMKFGPQDIGFDTSLISVEGIQKPPYAFMKDGYFTMDIPSSIKYWDVGSHLMPNGESIIGRASDGEGVLDWDSTEYNMILVKETEKFLDSHLENPVTKDQPFFGYVALGSVHIPHSPPDKYMDGSPVAGEYPTKHMDLLGEMDKVVGSLVEALETRQLLEDTIIIFTSDNGGLGNEKGSEEYGHSGSGPLRGIKGDIYEGGHRVPLMMRWDGGNISANETRSHLISLTDLYRTLGDIADVNVPSRQAIDSVSFARYIANETNTEDLRTSLGTWRMHKGVLEAEAVRKNNFKLIRHTSNGTVNLYDLDNDISEKHDISSVNEALVNEMYEELKTFGMCYDNPRRFVVKLRSGKVVKRGCPFFSRNMSRCKKFMEGQTNCRLTCATTKPCANFQSR